MFRVIIEAGRSETQYWKDLWRYRELFYFLAWRDVLVHYKQTFIGIAWTVIRPVMTMVVFTVLFGMIGKFPKPQGVPYPLLVFSAILPWQFFANALTASSGSLVGNANLISKVYFPRMIIPVSAVMVSLVEFLISFLVLCGMMIWYQYWPTWRMLCLPLLVVVVFAAAMGLGIWFTTLNVKYRDFRYIIPFMVQMGSYISPVGFSSDVVPERWRLLYSLNPMVGVIDGFRWAVLGGRNMIDPPGFALSLTLIAILLFGGMVYFRKMERRFADII